MTRRGACLLLLFALLLLSALDTGYSEIFYAVFLLGLLLAFALVSTVAGVFALQIRQQLSATSVLRGKKLSIHIALNATLPLPVIARVTLQFPGENLRSCAFQLFSTKRAVKYNNLPCPHRGLWMVGITKVRFGDILGIFSYTIPRSRLPELQPVTVLPLLQELPGYPLPPLPSMDYSEINPVTADQGDSFADTRLYRDGDPLKRIHWKLTVRTQELHTRQYEMSIDQMVVILVDTSLIENEPAEAALGYADLAAECAAALALYYVSGGHAVQVLPSGEPDSGVLIRTPEEFGAAYNLLAVTSFNTNTPIMDVLSSVMNNLSNISAFFAITHKPSAEMQEAMSRMISPQRRIALIYPGDAVPNDRESTQELNLIAISQPQDITERLGDCL